VGGRRCDARSEPQPEDTGLDLRRARGRDGAQALAIAERFGCRVVVVDPVGEHIEEGVRAAARHQHGHLVDMVMGTINEIPAGDGAFDAIFSRDMMLHVADIDGALTECRRVLRDGGSVVMHQVFATDLLEPLERDRMCADLAIVPERLSVTGFERAVVRAGFRIRALDLVGSEWLEALLEGEDGERRLLRAARLKRAKSELLDTVGEVPYRVLEGNNLYTIYRMIGKLEDRVYTLAT
jgi:SAM-dependent methyltransferase